MSLSTVIIKKKTENTGVILDIESQDYDRKITYPSGSKKFAVVKAAHYLDDDYIFFDDLTSACEFALDDPSINQFVTWIVGSNGYVYTPLGNLAYKLSA
jgi:hypothetical protein